MRLVLRNFSTLIFSIAIAVPSSAQAPKALTVSDIAKLPTVAVKLGRGVNSQTGVERGQAIEIEGGLLHPADVITKLSCRADVRIVDSQDVVDSMMSASVNGHAKFGAWSGDASASFKKSLHIDNRSTIIAVMITAVNSPIELSKTRLTEEARKSIKMGPTQFLIGFGDSYVRSVSTGGRLLLTHRVLHSSKQEMDDFRGSANVQAIGGNGIQIDGSELHKELSKLNIFDFEYKIEGGAGSPLPGINGDWITWIENFRDSCINFPALLSISLGDYYSGGMLDPRHFKFPLEQIKRVAQRYSDLEDFSKKIEAKRGILQGLVAQRSRFSNFPDDDISGKLLLSRGWLDALSVLRDKATILQTQDPLPVFDLKKLDPPALTRSARPITLLLAGVGNAGTHWAPASFPLAGENRLGRPTHNGGEQPAVVRARLITNGMSLTVKMKGKFLNGPLRAESPQWISESRQVQGTGADPELGSEIYAQIPEDGRWGKPGQQLHITGISMWLEGFDSDLYEIRFRPWSTTDGEPTLRMEGQRCLKLNAGGEPIGAFPTSSDGVALFSGNGSLDYLRAEVVPRAHLP